MKVGDLVVPKANCVSVLCDTIPAGELCRVREIHPCGRGYVRTVDTPLWVWLYTELRDWRPAEECPGTMMKIMLDRAEGWRP